MHRSEPGRARSTTPWICLRDGLNRLDDTIRTALEEAFACGKAEGQNIVRQLATGDMTLKDFEKHLEPR